MSGRIRYQRLNNNKWLAYSPSEDGGYCIPCVFFAQTKSNLGQLVCIPMVNLARAATTLSEHAKQATHIFAVETMLQLLNRFSVLIMMQNKKGMSIIKTVIFCARQNIAL